MEKSRNFHLKLPQAGYEELTKIAETKGVKLADLIRTAIEEYTERHGKRLDLKVEHGGYRERKDKP